VIEASPVNNKILELTPNINPEPFNLGVCCQSSKKADPIVSAFLLSAKQVS
jgi:hypothetical protein